MNRKRTLIRAFGWLLVFAASVAFAQPYSEAPTLAERTASGDLPAVEQRLPAEPYVVEVVEEIGQYGGTWHRAALGTSDLQGGLQRLEQEMFFHVNADGEVTNSVIKDYDFEVGEDESLFTAHLREGLKWSDGEPYIVDDILFYYQDVARYSPTEEEVAPPSWLTSNGEPFEMVKIDDYTLEIRMSGPNPLFTEFLLNPGSADRLTGNPKHYLSQFHPKYNPKEGVSAEDQWAEFQQLNEDTGRNAYLDPNRPTLSPWVTEIWEPGRRHVMVRNPYYWKVDPEGNQLPYIDRVETEIVENAEAITFKAINGEIDMQLRNLNVTDLPLLQTQQEQGDYRILVWQAALGADPGIYLNQNTTAPDLADLIHNREFRTALSLAINRDEINDTLWFGLATPRNATVHPASPYFVPEVEQLNAEYDPERAKQILDELGLTEKNNDGIRLGPDGNPISVTVDVSTSTVNASETLELVAEYWNNIGIGLNINPVERGLLFSRVRAGEHEAMVWTQDRMYFILPDMWVVPTKPLAWFAPLVGLWYESGGSAGVAPEGEMKELLDLWSEIGRTADAAQRDGMIRDLVRRTAEQVWTIGTVGLTPLPVVVKNNFRNVPEAAVPWDFVPMTPKNTFPEQYFIRQ